MTNPTPTLATADLSDLELLTKADIQSFARKVGLTEDVVTTKNNKADMIKAFRVAQVRRRRLLRKTTTEDVVEPHWDKGLIDAGPSLVKGGPISHTEDTRDRETPPPASDVAQMILNSARELRDRAHTVECHLMRTRVRITQAMAYLDAASEGPIEVDGADDVTPEELINNAKRILSFALKPCNVK